MLWDIHEAALQKSPCVLHGQPFCYFLKRDRNTGRSVLFLCQQVIKTCPPYPADVVYSLLIGAKTIGLTALTLSLAHAPNRETLPLRSIRERRVALRGNWLSCQRG